MVGSWIMQNKWIAAGVGLVTLGAGGLALNAAKNRRPTKRVIMHAKNLTLTRSEFKKHADKGLRQAMKDVESADRKKARDIKKAQKTKDSKKKAA